jgi:hypothetical protein
LAATNSRGTGGGVIKPHDLTGWEEMDINGHPYLAKIEKA